MSIDYKDGIIDQKNGIINGITWDALQERVRGYAGSHDLEVSPEHKIPLEVDCRRLRLYKDGALLPVAEFYPYFQKDGETLKYVKTAYIDDPSIKDLLTELGVTQVRF